MKNIYRTLIYLLLTAIFLSSCLVKPAKVFLISRSLQINNSSANQLTIDFKKGIFDFESQFGDQFDLEFKLPGQASAPQVQLDNNVERNIIKVDQTNQSLINSGEQWALKWGNDRPLSLNLNLGPALATLNLGGLPLKNFAISSERTVLNVNLTGYWPQPVKGVLETEKGKLSIFLPAGVPARVKINGNPDVIKSEPLIEQEGYLVNEIGLSQPAVVDLEINANESEISFSVGYPGDKQVRDVLIPAQMIFSKDQVYRCADHPDDGFHPNDTVTDLWYDYLCEYGPEHRNFSGDDQLTRELAKSTLIQDIRRAYYQGDQNWQQDQLVFDAGGFIGATADLLIKFQETRIQDFSITHFLGSFDYTIEEKDDRLIYTVNNQTDRASGTRVPFRYADSGYETSLEELVANDPNINNAYLLELMTSGRYPILSILQARPRELTTGSEGGGNFTQTFVWSEKLLDKDQVENLDIINNFELLDVK